ncbi:hypothetical protein BH11GEM2_BH11GEM2_32020 [soil metagenome]
MSAGRLVERWCVAVLPLVALVVDRPATVHAQTLASRIEAVGTGQVGFHFAGREGICGDGRRFMRIGSSYHGRWSDATRSAPCVTGPVQIRLTLEQGSVTRVETWVGPLRSREGRDLGEVPARESAQYCLSLAGHASGSAGANAILPAVLTDSTVVWPTLLNLARKASLPRSTRRETSFWLSRFAAGAVAGRKNDPLSEDDGDDDDLGLKKHAVFVLSQLPHDEGVPELINVVRSKLDLRVRSQALFWLGQSGDARALVVFESILRS